MLTIVEIKSKEEFDKLMDIYDKKGWTWLNGYKPKQHGNIVGQNGVYISYHDGFIYGYSIESFCHLDVDCITLKELEELEGLKGFKMYEEVEVCDIESDNDKDWEKRIFICDLGEDVENRYVVVYNREQLDGYIDYLNTFDGSTSEGVFERYCYIRKSQNKQKITLELTDEQLKKVKEFLQLK